MTKTRQSPSPPSETAPENRRFRVLIATFVAAPTAICIVVVALKLAGVIGTWEVVGSSALAAFAFAPFLIFIPQMMSPNFARSLGLIPALSTDDERERYIEGRAMHLAYIALLAMVIGLFFLSTVTSVTFNWLIGVLIVHNLVRALAVTYLGRPQ